MDTDVSSGERAHFQEVPELRPSRIRFVVELLAAVFLVALLVLLLVAMALRLVGHSEPWLFELTRVLFVYLVALSAIVAYARGQNLRVPGWWVEGSVSYEACQFVVALLVAAMALRYVYVQGLAIDATSLLGMPEVTPYLPVVMFGLGLSVVCLLRLIRALNSRATEAAA